MQRNETAVLILVVSTLLSSVGCATLARSKRQETSTTRTIRLIPLRDSENPEIVYSYIAIEDESYLDIINRQARENRPPQNIWKKKRHIGFFGMFKEFEKEIGVKVVIPF